ncbi:MAG TPA: Dabb family protein [Planctomycetota bacterium]|nr:Dabb family protein [Planctomycetota bacterium]
MPNDVQLVHDVYFQLQDASPAAKAALVAECYRRLAAIPGVVRLVAGTRDPELVRDVNDRDYDVSLHVWFRDRAAHDAYQTAPAHLAFIEANRSGWKKVRVFDSTIAPR